MPDAPNRSLVEDLIKDARDHAAAEREAEKKRLDLEQQRLDMERQAKEREAKEREQREAQERIQLAAQTQPAPEGKPVYKKWWFWGAVGGAVAVTAVTIVAVSGNTATVLPEGSLGTWDRR